MKLVNCMTLQFLSVEGNLIFMFWFADKKKLMPKFQQPNCIDIIYIEVMCIIPSWECRNCIKMKLDNSLLIWRVDLP